MALYFYQHFRWKLFFFQNKNDITAGRRREVPVWPWETKTDGRSEVQHAWEMQSWRPISFLNVKSEQNSFIARRILIFNINWNAISCLSHHFSNCSHLLCTSLWQTMQVIQHNTDKIKDLQAISRRAVIWSSSVNAKKYSAQAVDKTQRSNGSQLQKAQRVAQPAPNCSLLPERQTTNLWL